jgi:long-chain acyl-CoA synthetase
MPLGLRLRWAIADRAVLRRLRAVMGDRLQCMVTGSAPTPLHLLEEFHALGWLVLEAYGMSENVMPMAMNLPARFRLGTVGVVTPGNEIAIAPNSEVSVRGPGVFSRYVNASSTPPRGPGSYHFTGDLGALDDDGFLRLRGRTADFLKTSTGRRVSPEPIEATLRKSPGVDQVVVVGHGRKQIAAIVTLSTSDLPTGDAREALEHQLRLHIAKLAAAEQPAVVIVSERALAVERGELTANLKVRRAQVESNYSEALGRAFSRLVANGQPKESHTVFVWSPIAN